MQAKISTPLKDNQLAAAKMVCLLTSQHPSAASISMPFPRTMPAFPPSVDAKTAASAQREGFDSSAASMQRLAKMKKVTRASTKALIAKLDELLPPVNVNRQMESNALSRSSRTLGDSGRSFISILQDAAIAVTHKKNVLKMAHQNRNLGAVDTFKKVMMSNQSMPTIEVVFPSCLITSVSADFIGLIHKRCVSLSLHSMNLIHAQHGMLYSCLPSSPVHPQLLFFRSFLHKIMLIHISTFRCIIICCPSPHTHPPFFLVSGWAPLRPR